MTLNNNLKSTVPSEDLEHLVHLIQSADEQLLTAGQDNANRAFNIGCMAGLIPALLFMILTLVVTKGSWIAAVFMGILMIMGLFALANLIAYISRSNAYRRCYETEIGPEIEEALIQNGVDRQEFAQVTSDILPAGSPLLSFLDIENNPLDEDTNGWKNEEAKK
jgi:hypothetical protein